MCTTAAITTTTTTIIIIIIFIPSATATYPRYIHVYIPTLNSRYTYRPSSHKLSTVLYHVRMWCVNLFIPPISDKLCHDLEHVAQQQVARGLFSPSWSSSRLVIIIHLHHHHHHHHPPPLLPFSSRSQFPLPLSPSPLVCVWLSVDERSGRRWERELAGSGRG
jgi:hypothetical protein